MIKSKILLLFLTFALCACGGSGGGGTSGVEQSTNDLVPGGGTTIPVEGANVPDLALTFQTTGVRFIKMSQSQEKKMLDALRILRLVVATEEFRSKVLNHRYNGSKRFANNNGYSNAQIYQLILEGAEKLKPLKNNNVDMGVELYSANTNVIGYTYPNSTQIWVNTKYFNQYSAAGVAHNLMHEWLHKLGFGHDSEATARRPYSVPYAIGYMVKNIGQNFL